MLIPVDVPAGRRVWVEVAFKYDRYVYADSPDTASKFLLKYARVMGTYTDEQVSGDVRRSFTGMLRDGVPRRLAIDGVSEIYGILPACVATVVDGGGGPEVLVSGPPQVCQEGT